MKYIQGGQSGPAVINGSQAGAAGAPLSMSVLSFSAPIYLFSGFTAPDLVTITCEFTATAAPVGSFFLQGAISVFGAANGTQGLPTSTSWFTLPNPVVAITSGVQSINGNNLPLQPAVFRLFTPAPGVLFVRVGYAPTSGGSGDTASVYAIAVANN